MEILSETSKNLELGDSTAVKELLRIMQKRLSLFSFDFLHLLKSLKKIKY